MFFYVSDSHFFLLMITIVRAKETAYIKKYIQSLVKEVFLFLLDSRRCSRTRLCVLSLQTLKWLQPVGFSYYTGDVPGDTCHYNCEN